MQCGLSLCFKGKCSVSVIVFLRGKCSVVCHCVLKRVSAVWSLIVVLRG